MIVPDKQKAPRVALQTIRRSYAEILTGEDPWLPLGNFTHQFFGSYKHFRTELLQDPIELPKDPTPEQLQWAVFCAASVEYLAVRYELQCPEWALDTRYTLENPWYYAIGAELPWVQEKLRQTTPEEFSKRNIFCGNRTFNNKYEYKGRQGRKTA